MKVKITGRWGYANAQDMYRLLGVSRLPVEGMPARDIQGVQVYVKPLSAGPRLPRHGKRLSHRVIAICNCGQHVSVGRLHQHKCKSSDTELPQAARKMWS